MQIKNAPNNSLFRYGIISNQIGILWMPSYSWKLMHVDCGFVGSWGRLSAGSWFVK